MKRIAAVLCVTMLLFALVACGDQSSNEKNDQKKTTITENIVNTKKTDQIVDEQTIKPAETTRIDEKKEQILVELMTIRNIFEYPVINKIKDYYDTYTALDLIKNSSILDQDTKNKFIKSDEIDLSGCNYCKFKAILDVEIEKHKLP